MRRKLILEISQSETLIKQAKNDSSKARFMRVAAAPQIAPPSVPKCCAQVPTNSRTTAISQTNSSVVSDGFKPISTPIFVQTLGMSVVVHADYRSNTL